MPNKDNTAERLGQSAYERLDRFLHEKARLGIMTSLLEAPEGLLFGEVKKLCSLTDGNLSRQLQILSENGLVQILKGYKGRRPQTLCRLTPEGRERFLVYLNELEQVIKEARDKATASARMSHEEEHSSRYETLPLGWVLVQS